MRLAECSVRWVVGLQCTVCGSAAGIFSAMDGGGLRFCAWQAGGVALFAGGPLWPDPRRDHGWGLAFRNLFKRRLALCRSVFCDVSSGHEQRGLVERSFGLLEMMVRFRADSEKWRGEWRSLLVGRHGGGEIARSGVVSGGRCWLGATVAAR